MIREEWREYAETRENHSIVTTGYVDSDGTAAHASSNASSLGL